MKSYDHKKIEKKWQDKWEKDSAYRAEDDSSKPKDFLLIEFPYPSGDGLHVGHVRSYSAMDVIARKRRAQGRNVLYPIGWDAFGLPTENYAIKTGKDPRVVTKENSDNFRRQIKSLGLSFDWDREINTTDPSYYKWTQWIFLQLYKKGLAYKARTLINWCPKDKIGLANEEVVDGCCERCGTPVEKREKEQWMMAITKYARRLYDDLDLVDYIERAKTQQRNWIGPSEGAEIDFPVKTGQKDTYVLLHGFTGAPDTPRMRWLKENLEKHGHTVVVPALPDTENPHEDEQVAAALAATEYDEHTILCGFSLGAVVALKTVEKLSRPIKGIVLAGGFADCDFKDKPRIFESRFKWEFDGAKIRKNAGFIIQLQDENDYAVREEQAARLSKLLGVKTQYVTAEQPHFNGDTEPTVLRALVPHIKVFTTRADTIFGATYMVLAPEHPLVSELMDQFSNKEEVVAYQAKAKNETDIDRTAEGKEKTGVELKGIKAINPANNEEIPVFIADYVLATYGTGAIMAVPAHDERDREFAEKFSLPLRTVLEPVSHGADPEAFFTGYGKLADSGEFTGMSSQEAKVKITEFVSGKIVTTFKLRDWVFSRQRYWGEPIPMIHCDKCGIVPVLEAQLPVMLPEVEKYQPTDTGESPLANIDEWVNTICPNCAGLAKRETDVMPNWAGSSWYYLRYTDAHNGKAFAAPDKLKYWTPVDWYNGGMEHTVLHLLYSRFWHKFLFDQGLVPTPEPYMKRTSHGLILAEDGSKMSKSKGNTVSPDVLVQSVGADSLRLYEMFLGPFDQPVSWNSNGVVGMRRFLERVADLPVNDDTKLEPELETLMHQTIKKVTDDIENLKMNTAVSALMILLNECEKHDSISTEVHETFLKLLAPFAPHLAHELWEESGHSTEIRLEPWPVADETKAKGSTAHIAIQINGKTRGEFDAPIDSDKATLENLAKEAVKEKLEGKTIARVIVVPNRLVNFVISE